MTTEKDKEIEELKSLYLAKDAACKSLTKNVIEFQQENERLKEEGHKSFVLWSKKLAQAVSLGKRIEKELVQLKESVKGLDKYHIQCSCGYKFDINSMLYDADEEPVGLLKSLLKSDPQTSEPTVKGNLVTMPEPSYPKPIPDKDIDGKNLCMDCNTSEVWVYNVCEKCWKALCEKTYGKPQEQVEEKKTPKDVRSKGEWNTYVDVLGKHWIKWKEDDSCTRNWDIVSFMEWVLDELKIEKPQEQVEEIPGIYPKGSYEAYKYKLARKANLKKPTVSEPANGHQDDCDCSKCDSTEDGDGK